jgi:hypothetical protein
LQGFADRCWTHTLGAQVTHFGELQQIEKSKHIGNGDEACFLPASQLVGRDVQDPKDVRSTESVHVGSAQIAAELATIIDGSEFWRKWKTAQNGGKPGLTSLYAFGNPQLQSV